MLRRKDLCFLLFLLFFLASSIVISYGIKNIGTRNSNYITVKGLSEKEILSTSSSWNLQYDLNGNTVDDIIRTNNLNLSIIKNFFIKCGFDEEHIRIGSMNFNAQGYKDSLYRYSAYVSLTVNTRDLDKMKTAEKNIIELYNRGLLISNNGGPRYYFDKINDIKPEMLAESIRNAKLAALEFVKHSGSKLGKIKNANQGYFEFLPVDRSLGDQELYPQKILRIVTTISYYLD
ncbi:hypothetical protein OY14_01100 [Borreliella chilensis]|uniref:SIMPL domain-containing protein n=1 Tax=Borreliella chilensis TaxID=1245910 RepID=A0A0A7UV17_9SPIR|nr:hypothetical protein OY14_01100 [Borreliella chilensis]